MDAQVKNAMLNLDVDWFKKLSTSGAGDMVYDTAVTFKAYQSGKRVLVTTLEGAKVLSTVQIFLDAPDVARIIVGDQILPFGYLNKYTIVKIDLFYKERGLLDYGILYLS